MIKLIRRRLTCTNVMLSGLWDLLLLAVQRLNNPQSSRWWCYSSSGSVLLSHLAIIKQTRFHYNLDTEKLDTLKVNQLNFKSLQKLDIFSQQIAWTVLSSIVNDALDDFLRKLSFIQCMLKTGKIKTFEIKKDNFKNLIG